MTYTKEDRVKLYQRAIDAWGNDSQMMMGVEESVELALILLHVRRAGKNVTAMQVCTELVDVSVMVEQMRMIFDITDEQFEAERDFKISRLEQLLKKSAAIIKGE